MYSPSFASAKSIRRDQADYFKPPRRVAVSEAVRESLFVGRSRKWDENVTPYMIEILDTMSSREHEAVVFAKPARTGGTKALVDGTITYHVTCDPGRILVYFPTETNAHDYSKSELIPAHRWSEDLKNALSPRSHDNTITTRTYRNGMMTNILWPTSANVAQRTARVVLLSDYDSMADNIDGGDSPFDSAKKRVQVAMSAGMVAAESNPKRIVLSSGEKPKTAHEAPPTDGGILALYNRGDRRRWYWLCLYCGESFLCPPIPMYDESDDIEVAAASAFVPCPHCGGVHTSDQKRELNINGRWVPDGCHLEPDGLITGEPLRAKIASFWLVGCGAAYQRWDQIVREYLLGLKEYEDTGSEKKLKTTINQDQGLPYTPRSLAESSVGALEDKQEDTERYIVPNAARFLTATVDVQSGKNAAFVVQVHAHAPDYEQWIIDRYSITKSERINADGTAARIDPAGHQEDWDILEKKVVQATYRTTEPGKELRIRHVGVDSGGEDGVTENAYAWYRRMRKQGLHHRVSLIKGASAASAPRVEVRRPDTRKQKGASLGDVPVLFINTNMLKDAVWGSLQRDEPGPGYLHIPMWLGSWFLEELTAEIRTKKGWDKIRARNEAFDLCVYNRALALHLKVERINWNKPPGWARPVLENSELISADDRRRLHAPKRKRRKSTGSGFGTDDWNL